MKTSFRSLYPLLGVVMILLGGCSTFVVQRQSDAFSYSQFHLRVSYWKPKGWSAESTDRLPWGSGRILNPSRTVCPMSRSVDLYVRYWDELILWQEPTEEGQAQGRLVSYRHIEDDFTVMDKLYDVENPNFGKIAVYRYFSAISGSHYTSFILYKGGMIDVDMDVDWQKTKGDLPFREEYTHLVSSLSAK